MSCQNTSPKLKSLKAKSNFVKKNDYLSRLTQTQTEATTTIPSIKRAKNGSPETTKPFSRLKNSYKKNQYMFSKLKTKSPKKSKNKKIVTMPMSESEKREKVDAILEAGFTHHPDIKRPSPKVLNSDLIDDEFDDGIANYRVTKSSLEPHLAST